MANEKSMIIIGAGLAGLSTGCYAQMNGYNTHIFEHHSRPGGVCTTWERKGYTIDCCIHWLMDSKPGSPLYKIYEEVGALEGNRLIYLDYYGRLTDESSGKSLEFTADLDRLSKDMKALSPEDGRVIDKIIEGVRKLKSFEMDMSVPWELMGPLDMLKMFWSMRRFLKYFFRYNESVEEFTAKRVKNPFLRSCLDNAFLPEMPLPFLFMVLGQLADGKLASVEGGSSRFSEAIARKYLKSGGEISYKSTVEEILVDEDRAVGIRLQDGSEHRADIVVSAADGYSTIFEMLKGKFVNDKIRYRYENWPLFRPIVVVNFGLAKRFPDHPSSNVVMLSDPFSVGGKEIKGLFYRVFNDDPSLSPTGNTIVQAMIETEFDYWNQLRNDRSKYEEEKSRVANEILSRLEHYLTGISENVEMVDVATPYTYWRFTLNHRGAYEGWLMTKNMMKQRVEKTLPGLRNFYMAGQWVEPGGGVPAALFSAKNLVQILCKEDRKRFKTD